MSPELLGAVRERIALGHTTEMITKELIAAGYTADVVAEVLTEAQAPDPVNAVPMADTALPTASELFIQGLNFAKRYPVLVLLMALPFLVVEIVRQFLPVYTNTESIVAGGILVMLAVGAFVFQLLFTVTVIKTATVDEGSQKVPLGEAWRWATGHALGLMWIGILAALAFLGGWLLLIIPGLIVLFSVYLTQYVYVVEGKGGMSALLRSRELMQGNGWAVASRLLIILLIILGVMILLGIVTAVANEFLSDQIMPALALMGEQLLGAFLSLINIKIGLELYRNLAKKKPVTAIAPTAGRGLYVTLISLGLLAIVIVAVFLSLILQRIGVRPADILQYQDTKQRAIELRNEQTVEAESTLIESSTDGIE